MKSATAGIMHIALQAIRPRRVHALRFDVSHRLGGGQRHPRLSGVGSCLPQPSHSASAVSRVLSRRKLGLLARPRSVPRPRTLRVKPALSSLPYESDARLFGNVVRLTDERLDHVLEHGEMAKLGDELEHVLQSPSEVRRSRFDENVRLFYRFYAATAVGGKWLCVVVKYPTEDAFVINAYLTDSVKAGEILWPKN
jgi:hypothetical protein